MHQCVVKSVDLNSLFEEFCPCRCMRDHTVVLFDASDFQYVKDKFILVGWTR